MPTPLSTVTVAILATDGFEQVELTGPKKALEAAGATVHVVSPESGQIEGWDEDDWGDMVDVDRTLSDADPSSYDALVLPGGQINPDKLRIDADALDFVKAIAGAGKPIGAICHAPWVLIEAGLVEGRTMTSFKSIRTDLKNAGADVVDQEVARDTDGPFPLVTSRNPDDLPAFNDALVEVFAAAGQPA
jgi:protease I